MFDLATLRVRCCFEDKEFFGSVRLFASVGFPYFVTSAVSCLEIYFGFEAGARFSAFYNELL